jgi:hypothetical protein
MPNPIISASISAPRAAGKPRSAQYATMCTCGMDIATQHATPDTHSSPCSWLGETPSGRSRFDDAPRAPAPAGASPEIAGGFRRRASANNGIASKQIRPVPM